MDPLKKKLLKEMGFMQEQTGRMLRNMSIARMMPMSSARWQPPVDIYEAEQFVYVYVDVAGVEQTDLQVTVDDRRVYIWGKRQLPFLGTIACVHQLEIELGDFELSVDLPVVVDVDKVESRYSNGILIVTLPKRQKAGKVNIAITPGA
ncbi:Hsp20/alpha crystallin family protein [Desulfogranum japonicum]|uniref:Hsp20/alpha crystallin family protein n=1 Tax=Desulfogranum japonicum TaxID=231447 RepID=UPI00042A39BA|nr:Hsp20/alpha crystallin family protein [Desulfogranum japonicum]